MARHRFSVPAPQDALSLLAAAFLAAACGAGDRNASTATARDSAGIAIVENVSDASWEEGEAWRVAAEPAVDIGVVDGDASYQLHDVRGAVRLSDGRIAIANAGTHEIRFYDASGQYLTAVGGEGGGPGEFRGIGSLHRLADDSVLVEDWRLRRLTVLDDTGAFTRTVTLEPYEGLPPRPVGVMSRGTIVAIAEQVVMASEESGMLREPNVYLRYRMDGAFVDTIGVYPGDQKYVYVRSRSTTVAWPPFGRTTVVATGADRIFAGATDRYEIAVHRPSGAVTRIIRRAHSPIPVVPSDVERYRRVRLENAADDNARRRVRAMLAEMPVPETLPAYSEIEVDAAGHLWVADFRPSDAAPVRWSVFGPEGRQVGTVDTPPGLEILEIGTDYLLGRWTDEFDVEHVRLYGLDKSVVHQVNEADS